MAKRVTVTIEANPDATEDTGTVGHYGYTRHREPAFVARCNSCPWTAGADTKEDAEGAAEDHKGLHRAEAKQNTAR